MNTHLNKTTVYLNHWRDEAPLLALLEEFGDASGLRINLTKCAVVRLRFDSRLSAPLKHDLTLPPLDPRHQFRYLGAQIATQPGTTAIWETALQHLQARLHLATTKTTDLLQRIVIARAVAVPKIMYVARHCWPTAEVVRSLQTFIINYVWRNRLTDERGQGRAWLNRDVSYLPSVRGGLNIPNVTDELLLLASAAYQRWTEHRATPSRQAACVLLGSVTSFIATTRMPPRPPRLGRSVAATGRSVLQRLASTEWSTVETQLAARNCKLLLGRHRSFAPGQWVDAWWHHDYTQHKTQLYELQRVQRQQHGEFILAGLLAVPLCGTRLFVDLNGQPVARHAFSAICRNAATLGDVLAVEKTGESSLRFFCKTVQYPLTNRQAACFQTLCDTLVACYPDVLRTPNHPKQLQPRPATRDEWFFLAMWFESAACAICPSGRSRGSGDPPLHVRGHNARPPSYRSPHAPF